MGDCLPRSCVLPGAEQTNLKMVDSGTPEDVVVICEDRAQDEVPSAVKDENVKEQNKVCESGAIPSDNSPVDSSDEISDADEENINAPLQRYSKGLLVRGEKHIVKPKYSSTKIVVSQGSVVDFEGEVIVNAANSLNTGGGGVDGAITAAGGRQMAAERKAIPLIQEYQGVILPSPIRTPVGEAVCTSAGDKEKDSELHCDYVIHTVGPQFGFRRPAEEKAAQIKLLESAYKNTMEEFAKLVKGSPPGSGKRRVESLAFALISAGIFRGDLSLQEVLAVGVRTVREWLKEFVLQKKENANLITEVHFVGFKQEEVDTLLGCLTEAE